MGAHLASVHSSNEYRHIQKLTSDHDYMETWIGGTYEFEVPFFINTFLFLLMTDMSLMKIQKPLTDKSSLNNIMNNMGDLPAGYIRYVN